MSKGAKSLPFLLLLALLLALPVGAQKPDFGPHVVVSGVEFGTKAVAPLPANGPFDDLYVFPQLALSDQLLVGDAAPGDTDYNGGRWKVWTVRWEVEGVKDNPDLVPELKSEDDIYKYAAGYDGLKLTITEGSFDNGPPDYFECPLLPVLE